MPKSKSKSAYAKPGLSEKQHQHVSHLKKNSSVSKTELLLKGLELLSEYYALGLNEPPLNFELQNLEAEALYHATALRQVRKKKEAIAEMVRVLHNVEKTLDKYHNNSSALIQILLEIQEQNRWLPRLALIWVSEKLGIPWTQIYHIATFYKSFNLIPAGRHKVQVCLGTACQVRGAPLLLDKVKEVLKLEPGETDLEQKFSLSTVNCLGCCALGPVVAVDKDYYGNPSIEQLKQIAESYS